MDSIDFSQEKVLAMLEAMKSSQQWGLTPSRLSFIGLLEDCRRLVDETQGDASKSHYLQLQSIFKDGKKAFRAKNQMEWARVNRKLSNLNATLGGVKGTSSGQEKSPLESLVIEGVEKQLLGDLIATSSPVVPRYGSATRFRFPFSDTDIQADLKNIAVNEGSVSTILMFSDTDIQADLKNSLTLLEEAQSLDPDNQQVRRDIQAIKDVMN